KIAVCDTVNHITFTGEKFIYSFNKELGSLDFIQKDGKIITQNPIEYNLYRAPTDNDMYIKKAWINEGYNRIIPCTYDIALNEIEDGIEIVCPVSLQAIYLTNIAEVNAVWTIFNSGNITVKLDVKIPFARSFLPRFGLRLFLNDDFKQCEYFGYGPNESYVDKKLSCHMDKFTSNIADMFEDYIKPQENSSHCNTEYVKLSNCNTSLLATSDKSFSFNVCEYTQEELLTKSHNYELEKCGYKVLCLDYKMSGVGSNSCGPELVEKYQLIEKKFSLEINLIIE
ncbi:MAG: beta-galactosidase small subunit, partial [Oscillospiraceae bacterium]